MFNSQRLILGRKRRKLTARALALAIGVSPITISRLENGVNEPEDDTVEALARALNFPRGFFFAEDVDELPAEAASFRSLSSMTARERDAALSAGVIAYLFIDWVAERFNLPATDVPELRGDATPEAAAQVVRANWGLGELPISNMIKLLESKGVRVFSLCEDTNNVDAFSCWRGANPFVFLNTFKSTERSRFDAAHELGHLVMHRHGAPQDSRQAESEADRFASAFLMPTDDVMSRIRYVTDLENLIRAKKRWGVSVAALNYRLHKLRVVSEWQNRSLNIEMSSRGFRRQEPEGLPPETSALWPQIFTSLWRERITRDQIASELNVPTGELDAILHRLTGGVSDGGETTVRLRAI
ncbi:MULTISPECIES: helix-turn-helix domain-containing protein [unclassified Sphingomonas]|uniref:helix-turn-helix domain-containing protein n=1 Tax=unclassified Sphingomonas TaxID=196159 RepID=UPI0006FC3072|nr:MULTISPECIES: XRE family transcriptional regulator [unclassified Sphingomonas]KQS45677.1 XRE family transcriptional regulator [Sphingomonas sp. Leaf198]